MLNLADLAADSAASTDSTVVYYIIASIAFVLGAIAAALRYYSRQRERWTAEGQARAEQSSATKRNSEMLEENTTVMSALTKELHEFMVWARSELSMQDGRINRLERWREVHDRRSEERNQ